VLIKTANKINMSFRPEPLTRCVSAFELYDDVNDVYVVSSFPLVYVLFNMGYRHFGIQVMIRFT